MEWRERRSAGERDAIRPRAPAPSVHWCMGAFKNRHTTGTGPAREWRQPDTQAEREWHTTGRPIPYSRRFVLPFGHEPKKGSSPALLLQGQGSEQRERDLQMAVGSPCGRRGSVAQAQDGMGIRRRCPPGGGCHGEARRRADANERDEDLGKGLPGEGKAARTGGRARPKAAEPLSTCDGPTAHRHSHGTPGCAGACGVAAAGSTESSDAGGARPARGRFRGRHRAHAGGA